MEPEFITLDSFNKDIQLLIWLTARDKQTRVLTFFSKVKNKIIYSHFIYFDENIGTIGIVENYNNATWFINKKDL